jgi:hypothetical protein
MTAGLSGNATTIARNHQAGQDAVDQTVDNLPPVYNLGKMWWAWRQNKKTRRL